VISVYIANILSLMTWFIHVGSELKENITKKVMSNYFIVHPKVDQRAGLLTLPHLGIFAIKKLN